MNILLHSTRIFSNHENISRPFSDTDEKEEFFTQRGETKSIGRSLQLNGTVVTRVQ